MINRTITLVYEEAIMTSITANDLKTKGVAAIEAALAEQPEATVSVRGKDRFVVMDLSHYHYLRECELDAALAETRADLAAGRCVVETAAAHARRLDAELGPERSQDD
jgi:PHD/YefM family antitoxin component YafN of YafNO toxin-antitoxin module